MTTVMDRRLNRGAARSRVGKRKLMSWDTLQIVDAEVKFRLSMEDEDRSEEEIRNSAYSDSDLFAWEWESLLECLTNLMTSKQKDEGTYWRAEMHNFGWRKLNGEQVFEAETGQELLRRILPDTDCTFGIYGFGRGFAIQNAHHDSPLGDEWYYIVPIAASTYEKFRR